MHFVRVLTGLVLLLVHGCSTETRAPLTQLMLVTDTDMAELDGVEFHIQGPSGEVRSASGTIAVGSPASLSMVKGEAAALGPYRVEVRGLAGRQQLVSRIAELSFVPNLTRTALLHLARACSEPPSCDGDQVCALGACRPRVVSEAELVPWTGEPPRLRPEDGIDGGAPDASGDGEGGALDGTVAEGGACDPAQPRCQGELLAVCQDGVITGTMACPTTMDPCSRSQCVEGVGCAPVPAHDGEDCGPGLSCSEGTCGKGQQCTAKCMPNCRPGVLSCELSCSSGGHDCTTGCAKGSQCAIRCESASNCTGTCAGQCEVSCDSASNCAFTCQGGSSCDIDCSTGDGNCDKIRCQVGASCVLRCGASDSCEFEQCQGAPVRDCGNGVFACNASCP